MNPTRQLKLLTCIFALSLCCTLPVKAETLNISVAASMTDAFKEIITAFTAAHGDVHIRPNFASSGSLAKQIDQGAPADLYVSANPKWMKFLVEKEVITSGTDKIFAYNALVFVGQPEVKASDINALTDLSKIGIGTPQSVPAGQYAKQAMEKAGVYEKLATDKKLVMAKDVRQALLYADRGEVDGSFVYKTDALLATKAIILFTVPEDLYNRVSYPMGLTVSGAKKENAKALYDYLGSDAAKTVLEKYGFVITD